MSMVETNFHLRQVPDKLIPGDAIVPFELGLGVAPEVLDAIKMPPPAERKAVALMDVMMSIALRPQSVVPRELVRIDGRAFGNLPSDQRSEPLAGDVGDRLRVHLAAPLQQDKDSHFAGRPAGGRPLPWPPKEDSSASTSPRKGDLRSHSQARCRRNP